MNNFDNLLKVLQVIAFALVTLGIATQLEVDTTIELVTKISRLIVTGKPLANYQSYSFNTSFQ